MSNALPNRFEKPSFVKLLATILVLYLLINSFSGAEISIGTLVEGVPYMMEMFSEMIPPDISNLKSILISLFSTFQMAIAGTVLGVLLSLPLSVLASRRHSPNILIYYFTRSLLSFIRSVPDLVWALIFVVSVGLGPFAGTLALTIDTMAFCGRFFAETLEETATGPEEALKAIGAGRISSLFCATLPEALPSLINTALYSLEKATRASVVLGLVGAGGIGIELKTAMDMYRYAEAATIILSIFGLVVIVEQTSSYLRNRIIAG